MTEEMAGNGGYYLKPQAAAVLGLGDHDTALPQVT
jgi:hypothetical protein